MWEMLQYQESLIHFSAIDHMMYKPMQIISDFPHIHGFSPPLLGLLDFYFWSICIGSGSVTTWTNA